MLHDTPAAETSQVTVAESVAVPPAGTDVGEMVAVTAIGRIVIVALIDLVLS
jgi:hypothetical protein